MTTAAANTMSGERNTKRRGMARKIGQALTSVTTTIFKKRMMNSDGAPISPSGGAVVCPSLDFLTMASVYTDVKMKAMSERKGIGCRIAAPRIKTQARPVKG